MKMVYAMSKLFVVVTIVASACVTSQAATDIVSPILDHDAGRHGVMVVQYAGQGGVLQLCKDSNFGYLTLNGISDNSFEFYHTNGSATNAVREAQTDQLNLMTQEAVSVDHHDATQSRFALLVLGVPEYAADKPTALAGDLTKTSMISMDLLELIDEPAPTSTLKYKVKLGDVELHTDIYRADARNDTKYVEYVFGEGTLMIDLIDSDDANLSEQDKVNSIRHQTQIGAVSESYERQLKGSEDGVVLSQGIMTGPLMLICCPFAFLEAPFPLLWGFVVAKLICCII